MLYEVITAKIEELNEKKASVMYSEIDLNPLFNGFASYNFV